MSLMAAWPKARLTTPGSSETGQDCDSLSASRPAIDIDRESLLGEGSQPLPEVFERLYDEYRDRVYWYLLRRTGRPEDAADLTQEVFLKAFRIRDQYRVDRGSIASWLLTISRSLANTFGSSRRPTVDWAVLPEATMGFHPGPDADPIEVDELDRLRTCLRQLEPRGQELILLRFESGLTVNEISAVLGKTTEATKKQLQRTLQRLREIYDDDTR
jgi:RNA polymerase sigma-70 factor (ECF subfamily)